MWAQGILQEAADLQRFGQLSATGISRVHGDEGHYSWLQAHLDVLKDEVLLASPNRIQYRLQGIKHLWITAEQSSLPTQCLGICITC